MTVRGSLRVGTRTVERTKTEASRRTVSIDAGTAALLREHRSRQVRPLGMDAENGFVFRSAAHTPWDHRNLIRRWHAALLAAGLPKLRFHDLRHGHATMALERGVPLAVISKSLGHASLSTTSDVYSHLTSSMGDQVAAAMGTALGPVRSRGSAAS